MNGEPSSLKISDMALASFLHAIGAQLVAVDRRNPARCVFCFKLSTDRRAPLPNGNVGPPWLMRWLSGIRSKS